MIEKNKQKTLNEKMDYNANLDLYNKDIKYDRKTETRSKLNTWSKCCDQHCP